jgi:hypothetical protein
MLAPLDRQYAKLTPHITSGAKSQTKKTPPSWNSTAAFLT